MPLQKVLQQSPATVAKNHISGTYSKASGQLRGSRKPAPFGSPKIKKTNPFYFPTLGCSPLLRNILSRCVRVRAFMKIMPFKPSLVARSLDLRHNSPIRERVRALWGSCPLASVCFPSYYCRYIGRWKWLNGKCPREKDTGHRGRRVYRLAPGRNPA